MGSGQVAEMVQQRRAQPVQSCERELHLGLDARGPPDATSGCAFLKVAEQRGLADAGLTPQDEDAAARRAHIVDDAIEGSAFALAPPQG